ncbi:ATP binding protein [Aureococcus anophagefferens]|nr:ATP binding protein [Aureococcus anophagefferens]
MDTVRALKIKELKALIERAGLEHADCLDKDALVERAATAVARLGACKQAQDAASGALRVDRLLGDCGVARGETVEDDVRALARDCGVNFVSVPETLPLLEREILGSAAAPRPEELWTGSVAAAPAPAPRTDVDSRRDALALAAEPLEDLSVRELRTLVVHGGGSPLASRRRASSRSRRRPSSSSRTPAPATTTTSSACSGTAASASLKTHQPEAARLCAGLPRGWPRDDLGGDLEGVLRAAPPFVGRGVLLADVMGLGKTVECLAGAVLRDAVSRATGDDDLPTFVVAPNDAVLTQWREHLLRGVVAAASKVHVYKGAFKSRVARYESAVARGATWVLLTRYTLQTEVQGAYDAALDGASLAAAGKAKRGEKNTLLHKGETEADCVRRLVAGFFFGGGRSSAVVKAEAAKAEGAARRVACSSTTVIIDEAHFLRNATSKWGIGAALLGHSSKFCVSATGTPYNNGPQDMAALVSFFDARQDAATKAWWVDACATHESPAKTAAVQKAVATWRPRGLLRRDKSVLSEQLPPRVVRSLPVTPSLAELYCYVPLQAAFFDVLSKFARLAEQGLEKREKIKLFKLLLSIMTLMRMATVHSVLPRNGRELTKLFSKSRRRAKRLACWKADQCVCHQSLVEAADDADRAGLLQMGSAARVGARAEAVGSGGRATDAIDLDDGEEAKDADDDELAASAPAAYAKMGDGPLYCAEVHGGFRASAKLVAAVAAVRKAVARGEAVVFWTFYKGVSDLAEAMLDAHGVSSLRFDGDVRADERGAVLDDFRAGGADVLLATVHSGGTGLNITRATTVVFTDRWFNPQVHEQAVDRCHRIGQTKPVAAAFYDAALTIDDCMRHVNDIKLDNATGVIGAKMRELADALAVAHGGAPPAAAPPPSGATPKKTKRRAAKVEEPSDDDDDGPAPHRGGQRPANDGGCVVA